jgi:hypothetical protein
MTDYAELVERLRFGIDPHNVVYGWQADCLVAADAIEALEAERDRYKANQQQWVAAFQDARDRAEKAEADLSAVEEEAAPPAYYCAICPHQPPGSVECLVEFCPPECKETHHD